MIAPQVPPADEVTADWWQATGEHRLTVQACGSCSGRQFPPRAVCISCGQTEQLQWAACTGRGVIDAVTVVHRAPRPDLEVPYVIARVRLDEGPIMLTRLVGREPDAWRFDEAVKVAWVDLDDGRALPVFKLAD